MLFSKISQKIKQEISSSADKILSTKLKDQLGLTKPTIDSLHSLSENTDLDSNINSFYKPVNSNYAGKSDYKKIQNWIVLITGVVCLALVLLLSSIIIPRQTYSNALHDSQVIVKGNKINDVDQETFSEKVFKDEDKDHESQESLKVENLVLDESSARDLAKRSPLLKSKDITLVEYKVQTGDTLETIARKFYGSASVENLDKIKNTNHIGSSRSLRLGQKILIAF